MATNHRSHTICTVWIINEHVQKETWCKPSGDWRWSTAAAMFSAALKTNSDSDGQRSSATPGTQKPVVAISTFLDDQLWLPHRPQKACVITFLFPARKMDMENLDDVF
jgi:hypothetical protein